MSTQNSQSRGNINTVKFNFHRLRITPLKIHSELDTKSIVKQIFGYLNQELIHRRGHLIDRNKNRKGEDPRELFMAIAGTELKKSRIRGTLALLRSGRLPLLKPAETFTLVELDKSKGEIAEQTHFFIDYSKDECVICMEFNNNGPRMSDLEYYLRNVGSDKLGFSKATTIETFMDSSIEDALAGLLNVLNFDIKVQPKRIDNLDLDMQGYFNVMRNFGNQVKPKYIKLEASFQGPGGKKYKAKDENKEANSMMRTLFKRFIDKPHNLDTFDNFVVKYEDKEGKEEVLNLLKGKKEISKDVDLSTLKSSKDWYKLIEDDFDFFMQNL